MMDMTDRMLSSIEVSTLFELDKITITADNLHPVLSS